MIKKSIAFILTFCTFSSFASDNLYCEGRTFEGLISMDISYGRNGHGSSSVVHLNGQPLVDQLGEFRKETLNYGGRFATVRYGFFVDADASGNRPQIGNCVLQNLEATSNPASLGHTFKQLALATGVSLSLRCPTTLRKLHTTCKVAE